MEKQMTKELKQARIQELRSMLDPLTLYAAIVNGTLSRRGVQGLALLNELRDLEEGPKAGPELAVIEGSRAAA